ncbi:MAG: sodium:solute symporter family protein [Planctomycetota bacterium]
MEFAILIGFGILLLLLAVYGYKISAKTAEDYMLAGRGIGIVVMFFFALFTISSVWTFYGYPGFLYRNGPGFVYFIWGCLIGFISLYMFLGPRFWAVSRLNHFLSPVETIAHRYESKGLRLLMALVLLAAVIPYVADQSLGVGLGFSALTEQPMWVGILFTSIILVMIVLLGGMRLTAWVNILLGSLFTISFLGALLWITYKVFPGGFTEAVEKLQTNWDGNLHQVEGGSNLWSTPGPEGRFTPDFTAGVFVVGLLAVTWPHVVVGTMTAQDKRIFKWMPILGLAVAGFFFYSIPFFFGAVVAPAIGTLPDTKVPYKSIEQETRILLEKAEAEGKTLSEEDARMQAGKSVREHADKIVQTTVKAYLPKWFSMFVMIGVIGAAISTASVQLMTSSIIIARDLVHGFFKPDAGDRFLVLSTKCSVVGVLLLSTLIAYWYPVELALYLVNIAVPGFAQWGPAMVGGILWKRGTKAGAIAGTAVGSLYLLVGVVLSVVLFGSSELVEPRIFFGKNPAIPTLAINVVLYVVVSLLTRKPSETVRRRFFDEVEAFLAKKG